MTTNHDVFRPHCEPARTVYDAFQNEAALRKGRAIEDWMDKERQAVWRAARDYAQQHGLRIPTMEEVQRGEVYAMGSTDYGAQWAYQVERYMQMPA